MILSIIIGAVVFVLAAIILFIFKRRYLGLAPVLGAIALVITRLATASAVWRTGWLLVTVLAVSALTIVLIATNRTFRLRSASGGFFAGVLAFIVVLLVPFGHLSAASADDDNDDNNGGGTGDTEEIVDYRCDNLSDNQEFAANLPGPALGLLGTNKPLPDDKEKIPSAIKGQVVADELPALYWATLNPTYILDDLSVAQNAIDYQALIKAWENDPELRKEACERTFVELDEGAGSNEAVLDEGYVPPAQYSLLVYKDGYTSIGWECHIEPPASGKLTILSWNRTNMEGANEGDPTSTVRVAVDFNAIYVEECVAGADVVTGAIGTPTSTPESTSTSSSSSTSQPATADTSAEATESTTATDTGTGTADTGNGGGETGTGEGTPSGGCGGTCGETPTGPGTGGGEGCGECPGPTPGGGTTPGCGTCPGPGTTPGTTPGTSPGTSAPPQTQPPATNPPATQPPVTQPPATTQPPVTQPPVTQPPATTQPPVTNPPQTTTTTTAPCPPGYTRLPNGDCKAPDPGVPDV